MQIGILRFLQRIGFLNVIIEILSKLGLLSFAFKQYERLIATRGDNSLASRRSSGEDRLPIPPPDLRVLVAGTPDAAWFISSGKATLDAILKTLRENGIAVEGLGAVLEFGCGCGRVTRHWHSWNGPSVYGVDYHPKLIEWCEQNLPFAKFDTNHRLPPLPYSDAQFDCIYAISVLTHLSEELQQMWIKELARILKTDGYLLITTHGRNHTQKLSRKELTDFEAGRLVVRYAKASGMNLCNAYHPETYVRKVLAAEYSVVDFAPAGTHDAISQDLYLLRKNLARGLE